MKKKILCLVQLAPPVHGASMMNGYLTESKLINDHFTLEIINLQFNKTLGELKTFSVTKTFKAFAYAFRIVNKMIRFKPDLVYFTLSSKGFAFYRDAFYIFLIKRFKTKIIFHLHSKGIKKNSESTFLNKFLYSRVFNNTETICLSNNLRQDIEDVSKSKPYVVPCGIPVTKKSGINTEKKINPVPQILYLSNFIEAKGILVFIDALGLLKEKGRVFNARLVGAPADVTMEIVEKKIKDKNLTSFIEVVGPLYNEKKNEEYKNADLFVFPTFYENEAFPLVLLEALKFSLPVISTFEGGIPEMIENNETGLLVEGQNAEMLANRMSSLLDDPLLRTEMGNKGYNRFINNYTLEHFEHRILKTFDDVLNKTGNNTKNAVNY
jgi:glycosyltransferase involved in cell wall biosynthesis